MCKVVIITNKVNRDIIQSNKQKLPEKHEHILLNHCQWQSGKNHVFTDFSAVLLDPKD